MTHPPLLLVERHQRHGERLLAHLTRLDEATGEHSKQVGELAAVVAGELGLPDWEIEAVRIAGMLHDVGKVAVEPSVLQKTEPLNDDEWLALRRHPLTGEALVRDALGLSDDAAMAIRHHHERFDGRGYPDGLAGEEIPLAARIVAVVDAFDAMTSDRPYRRAMSPWQARDEVERCAGTHFCPNVVAAFLSATAISEAA